MRIVPRIFRFLFVTLLISLLVTTYITGHTVFKKSMQLTNNERSSREKIEQLLNSKPTTHIDSLRKKYQVVPLELTSSVDGHAIPGYFLGNDTVVNKKSVIMVHGLGGNCLACFPRAQLFLQRGYNVYVYDQRSSGNNQAPYTTYGALEREDLKEYAHYVRTRITKDKSLLVWGVSFGGATVGNSLSDRGIQQMVDTAILECPVSGIHDMLTKSLNRKDRTAPAILPTWYIIAAGNLMTRVKLGFSYSDAEVAHNIANTSVPCVIFNSRSDKITPYAMGKKIFDAIKNKNKELITVDDCPHARIMYQHPKLYIKSIWGQ